MKRRIGVVFGLAVWMICGCSTNNRYLETRGVLDNSLYYYEQDSTGKSHQISSAGPVGDETIPSRVPQPALVDMDSIIHIIVSKEGLSPTDNNQSLLVQADDLLKRKKEVYRALEELELVVNSRKKAVDAYYEKTGNFTEAKQEFGKIDSEFITKLMTLWPDGTPDYYELEEAYDPPNFKMLQQFLQARIDEIESEDQAIEYELKEHAISVRLEAILTSPGKDPVAVHLDGYDFIKQGDFQRRDRAGLDLSEAEKNRLDSQVKWTQEIAAAAERVREGEISLQDAIEDAITGIPGRLGELSREARNILSKYEGNAFQNRLDQIENDYREFVDAFLLHAEDLTDSVRQDFAETPQAFRSYLADESTGISKVVVLMSDIEALEQKWSHITPSEYYSLISDIEALLKKISEIKIESPEMPGNTMKSLESFLKTSLASVSATAENTLRSFLESGAAEQLRSDLESFYGDLRTIHNFVAEAKTVLDVSTIQPVAVGTRVPENILVPYDYIKNTFVDLNFTPRLQGDILTVQSTLYYGELERDRATASFQVERFGWFAELSPAVVLVKPDELSGENDGFRFAPTLSWMHHYLPRSEATSWHAQLQRGLQPAIGIHSAFINFDSDESNSVIQVGLGTTVSIWNDRLQFGAGYNLMADSDQAGRYYYFIGTDLIGLLQTIGIGK